VPEASHGCARGLLRVCQRLIRGVPRTVSAGVGRVQALCEDHDPVVCSLAVLSLCAIFRDIIPGSVPGTADVTPGSAPAPLMSPQGQCQHC